MVLGFQGKNTGFHIYGKKEVKMIIVLRIESDVQKITVADLYDIKDALEKKGFVFKLDSDDEDKHWTITLIR